VEIVQHVEYVPFGEVFIEERNNKWNTSYLFNAKELDEETGLYYYGTRYYDARVSIFISPDPLQEKYPNKTTYHYCSNNPINAIDHDGRDVVYINHTGTEVHRIKNDKVFETYIQSTTNAGNPSQNTTGWVSVPMPNIIQTRTQSGEIVSGAEYQANDYLIAARTGYFNQAKNAGTLELYTQGGNAAPQEFVKSIPDLDPTLVKAMTIQESHGGVTGITDIMQVNNGGDLGEQEKQNTE
jgi:RHS repeat-associated protein